MGNDLKSKSRFQSRRPKRSSLVSADQRRGSATRTEMARPIHSTSWRSSMAFFSSSALPRSTKAKPRLRPVSRSRGIEHLLTSPNWLNKWMRSSLSASQERLPKKIVKKLIQKGYHHFHTSPQALAVSTCSGEGERTSTKQCREQNQLWGLRW